MRLINVETLTLHEFSEQNTPRYGILSHTWGEQELSYLDLLFLSSNLPAGATSIVQALLRSPSKDSLGYKKLGSCCKLAHSRGLRWVWIDTCCIDQSSSAELSEAINSMWSWYRQATECYVYLSDVSLEPDLEEDTVDALQRFGRARWFSRGWTLQELLAPCTVLFCNDGWNIFAEKSQITAALSQITRIPSVFLDGTYDPSDCKVCSVAMKMSWLALRETTRIEDMAYCMLGLFDVHMPLIYGEGRKAFMRLQLEIMKKTDDDSIYCWKANVPKYGLLASWPTAFVDSTNIVQINFPDDPTPWMPPVMTSLGLEMRGRYRRDDPQQRSIDARNNVHTISTALPMADRMSMVMHCGPCEEGHDPITRDWYRGHRGKAHIIHMERSGAIWQRGARWQRVNCNQLEFIEYTYESSLEDAYVLYYFEQQGL